MAKTSSLAIVQSMCSVSLVRPRCSCLNFGGILDLSSLRFYFIIWFPFLLQVVITQAKVTADQEVMYKYISKNLLFLATVAPKAVGPIGSVTPDESSLVVYVIDTVTGRILHRVTHHGSQGPVHAVSLPFIAII